MRSELAGTPADPAPIGDLDRIPSGDLLHVDAAISIDVAGKRKRGSVEIRVGVHTGEVEMRGEDVTGLAVHLAARIMGEAGTGEVLVSRTVKDLVVGSSFKFSGRGPRSLKGIDGEWELFSVDSQEQKGRQP